MRQIIELDGKKYVRIGNKALGPFTDVGPDGAPVIKPVIEDFINSEGKPSKRIIVPCLTIQIAKT